MAWSDFSAISNVDLSGADVYVEGRYIGAALGPCTTTHEVTLRPYRSGYPSRVRGHEITSEKFSVDFSFLELVPENLEMTFPAGLLQRVGTTDIIHIGTASQPVVWAPVVVHKYNPGNGKHYLIRLWRAQVTSSMSLSYDQESTNFVAIDVTLEAIDTAGHGSDRLGNVVISDTFDTGMLQ